MSPSVRRDPRVYKDNVLPLCCGVVHPAFSSASSHATVTLSTARVRYTHTPLVCHEWTKLPTPRLSTPREVSAGVPIRRRPNPAPGAVVGPRLFRPDHHRRAVGVGAAELGRQGRRSRADLEPGDLRSAGLVGRRCGTRQADPPAAIAPLDRRFHRADLVFGQLGGASAPRVARRSACAGARAATHAGPACPRSPGHPLGRCRRPPRSRVPPSGRGAPSRPPGRRGTRRRGWRRNSDRGRRRRSSPRRRR